MCFVLALFQVHPHYPLIVAANRDEARARPSRPPFRWPGTTTIWAGRDDVAGGTWLGVNAGGLLAAITNRRDGAIDPSLPTRGLLCLGTLRQPSPAAAHAFVSSELEAHRYNPFNLLCASPSEAWVCTWRGATRLLGPGPHVVTNHGDADDDALPMVRRALAHVASLDLTAPLDALLAALGRLCADTTEPDPICRPGGDRGTVSSSLIALDADGGIAAYWHAEGPPTEHPYTPISLPAREPRPT